MGTSASSRGPNSGVPLVPSWVDPAATTTAPPRRFQQARTNLGRFGSSGSSNDLKSGLSGYSKSGMGGAKTAAARMAGSAKRAGGLYEVLDTLGTGGTLPPDLGLEPNDLVGKTQREIADLIVEAVCPVDGSQDAEASRDSVSRALSDLLEDNPNADLTALSTLEIEQVVQSFIAYDIAQRVEFDVGKAILDKAPSAAVAVERMEEMKDYVRQAVLRSFQSQAGAGNKMNKANATALSKAIIQETFEIFESYL